MDLANSHFRDALGECVDDWVPDDKDEDEQPPVPARLPSSSGVRRVERGGDGKRKPSLLEQVQNIQASNKAALDRRRMMLSEQMPSSQSQNVGQIQYRKVRNDINRSSSPAAPGAVQSMLPSHSRSPQQSQRLNDDEPLSSPPALRINNQLVPEEDYGKFEVQVPRLTRSGRSSSPATPDTNDRLLLRQGNTQRHLKFPQERNSHRSRSPVPFGPPGGKQRSQPYIPKHSTTTTPILAEWMSEPPSTLRSGKTVPQLFPIFPPRPDGNNSKSSRNKPQLTSAVQAPLVNNPTNSRNKTRRNHSITESLHTLPRPQARVEDIISSPPNVFYYSSPANTARNEARPCPNPAIQPQNFKVSSPNSGHPNCGSSPPILTTYPSWLDNSTNSSPSTIASNRPRANPPVHDIWAPPLNFFPHPPEPMVWNDPGPFPIITFPDHHFDAPLPQKRRSLDEIFDTIEGRREIAPETHSFHTASSILSSLRELELRPKKPVPTSQVIYRIDIGILAISKIHLSTAPRPDPPLFSNWHYPIHIEDEDGEFCSFCTFECDFGVFDERVWMDVEASGGYCQECYEAADGVASDLEDRFRTDPGFYEHVDAERVEELRRDHGGCVKPLRELAEREGFWEKAEKMRLERIKKREQANPGQMPARYLGRGGGRGLGRFGVVAVHGPLPQNMKGFGQHMTGRGTGNLEQVMRENPGLMFPQHMQASGFRGPGHLSAAGVTANAAVPIPGLVQNVTEHGAGGFEQTELRLRGGSGGSPPPRTKNSSSNKPAKSSAGSQTKPIDVETILTPKPPTSRPTIKTNPDEEDHRALTNQLPSYGGKEPISLTKKLSAAIQKKTAKATGTPPQKGSKPNPALDQRSPLDVRTDIEKPGVLQPDLDVFEEEIPPLQPQSSAGRPKRTQTPANISAKSQHERNSGAATVPQLPIKNTASGKKGNANTPATASAKKPDSTTKKDATKKTKRSASPSAELLEPKPKKPRTEVAQQPLATTVGRDPRLQKFLPAQLQANAQAKGSTKVDGPGILPLQTSGNMGARNEKISAVISQVKEKEAAPEKAAAGASIAHSDGIQKTASSESLKSTANKLGLAPNMPHSNGRSSNSQLAHTSQPSGRTSLSSQVPMTSNSGPVSQSMGTASKENQIASSSTQSTLRSIPSSSSYNSGVPLQRKSSTQSLHEDGSRPKNPSRLHISETASPPHRPTILAPPQLPLVQLPEICHTMRPQQFSQGVNAGQQRPHAALLQSSHLRRPAAHQQHPQQAMPQQRPAQAPRRQTSQFLYPPGFQPQPGNQQQPPPPPPPQLISPFSEKVTRSPQVLFCRGSPYRQVDVDRARICKTCYDEKLAIIKHSHPLFISMRNVDMENRGYRMCDGKEVPVGRNARNCMVCPDIASYKCAGCPLRLCVTCKCFLVNGSNGKLTDLIFNHHRNHIRNDAFLLRADGAGY